MIEKKKNTKDPLAADFRNMCYLIWHHLNLPEPTPLQYDIANFLQTSSSRIAIEASRGIGKSYLTAAYVLWELYKDPQRKIMVVSASKLRADNFVIFCLRLIEDIPQLKWLAPKDNQRQSRVEFDVGPATPDQSASVFARGIDSQLAGGRADTIVVDDVEIPNNSQTVEMRDKLKEKTKEFSAILKPLPTSRIIYLGTPQTEESIYNELPATFVKRIWPAQVPTPAERPAYHDDLAPMVQAMFDEGNYGDACDPVRFPKDVLEERRTEYGAAGYQLQFMLNTQLSDEERYPLKLRNLVVCDVPYDEAPVSVKWLPHQNRWLKTLPHHGMAGDKYYEPFEFGQMWKKYNQKIMAIDPSGRGADETSFAVGYELAGNIWIPEAGGMPGGYEGNTLERLADIAAKHKVNEIIIESNFGDGMFTQLFLPVLLKKHRCHVEEVRHSMMKEQRILDTLEPVVSRHRLIVDPKVIEEDNKSIQGYEMMKRNSRSLFYQMTHICRERGALRHDDRVDALAILVARFVEIMSQDSDNVEKSELQKWSEEQLKRHVDFIKRQPQKKTRKRGYVSRV